MPWDTSEIQQMTDQASPFATAPRGPTPPDTENDVTAGDAFATHESPFSAYTPDGNAETEEEDESADRLPGYAIEETLRPVNEEEGEDESFEGVSSTSYESEAAFAPAYEGLFESPFAEAESAFTSVAETEAAYEQEEAEEEFETPSGADLRRRIVDTALAELGVWEHGARHELEDRMHPTLKAYWETLLSPKKADAYIKAGHAWSAAFISTVMKRAGAGSAFRQDPYHAGYVANAKDAKDSSDATKFWAFDARTTKPELGDVVVRSRMSESSPVCIVSYGNVTGNRSASSHGDIVVAVRPDSIDVVGGNVGGPRPKKSDTVAQKTLKLDGKSVV